MRLQGLADDEQLLRSGNEQPVAEVIELSLIDRQQTQAGVQLPTSIVAGLGAFVDFAKRDIEPVPVWTHFAHDFRHVLDRGLEQASLQALGPLATIAFAAAKSRSTSAVEIATPHAA